MKAFFSFLIINGRRRNKKTCFFFFFFSDSSLLLDVYLLLLLLPDTHTHRQISFSFDVKFCIFFFSGVHSSRHGTFSSYIKFFLSSIPNCVYTQPTVNSTRNKSFWQCLVISAPEAFGNLFFFIFLFRSFVRSLCIDDTDTIKNLRRCRERDNRFIRFSCYKLIHLIFWLLLVSAAVTKSEKESSSSFFFFYLYGKGLKRRT